MPSFHTDVFVLVTVWFVLTSTTPSHLQPPDLCHNLPLQTLLGLDHASTLLSPSLSVLPQHQHRQIHRQQLNQQQHQHIQQQQHQQTQQQQQHKPTQHFPKPPKKHYKPKQQSRGDTLDMMDISHRKSHYTLDASRPTKPLIRQPPTQPSDHQPPNFKPTQPSSQSTSQTSKQPLKQSTNQLPNQPPNQPPSQPPNLINDQSLDDSLEDSFDQLHRPLANNHFSQPGIQTPLNHPNHSNTTNQHARKARRYRAGQGDGQEDIHGDRQNEVGRQIAEVLKRISVEDVDEVLLDQDCERVLEGVGEEHVTKALKDSLQCFQALLHDYLREMDTLASLNLRRNDLLRFQVKGLLRLLEQSRKHPTTPNNTTAYDRLNIHPPQNGTKLPAWKTFQNGISKQGLCTNDTHLLDKLEEDLRTLAIVDVSEMPEHGTQMKLVMLLSDGSKAIFKPKRNEREMAETMDIYYMYEKEKHTAEIAAYHLDRILEFNSVPPVVGRVVDIGEEIYPFMVEETQEQFFFSPAANLCFYTECDYFCSAAHAICGVKQELEGSFAAFLPDYDLADWHSLSNPWKRSYSKYKEAEWEETKDPLGYCEKVREELPFSQNTSILNVIDTAIFDFFMGNKDRHHFYYFDKYGNESHFVLFDNGKGFGRPHNDILDILAPLYQCCLVRFSTFKRLTTFHTDPTQRLSDLMRESLSRDVLPSILTAAHLRSLDRRVRIVLEEIMRCVERRGGVRNVVIDDAFYFSRD